MRRTMVWYLLLVTAVICCILAAGYIRRTSAPENAVLAGTDVFICAQSNYAYGEIFAENSEEGEPDVWQPFYI